MKTKNITESGWVGIALIAASLLGWSGRSLWVNTRTWKSVDLPISLEKDSHIETKEFRVNISGRYFIDIYFESIMPFHTQACLVGLKKMGDGDCTEKSVVALKWTLTNNGNIIDQENSSEYYHGGGGSDTAGVFRTFGYFEGKKDERYKLELHILEDGTVLNEAHPKLIINYSSAKHASQLVLSGLLRIIFIIIIAFGSLLIFMSTTDQKERE